jgi:8-oxo-dGTP pyrophosphatase MutT (NUDIX family)
MHKYSNSEIYKDNANIMIGSYRIKMNEQYCNNCGKQGHLYHQCKMPITSIGVIVFRFYENKLQYLMIRRRDTLGYIDFMRGKYSVYNKDYILNMVKQMTDREKNNLLTKDFDVLWAELWGKEEISNQYKTEQFVSREKFNSLNAGVIFKDETHSINTIIEEANTCKKWEEPEWGFPKGRRNYQENDYDCALREFAEETGFDINHLHTINNILPFEEIFTGSNYKSYKHKYYLTYMDVCNTLNMNNYERTEVSKMEWKTFGECIQCIREYNLEKIRLITNINKTISGFRLFMPR